MESDLGKTAVSAAANARLLLTVNGGSSSVKFAVFSCASTPQQLFGGQIERIGTPGARLTITQKGIAEPETRPVDGATFDAGIAGIVTYLRERVDTSAIVGIGHRIVLGGVHLLEHQLVTTDLIAELRRTQPLDLAHLPREIALIDSIGRAFPSVPQVACFDTAFHRDLPHLAQLLPIPHRYLDAGVRRFGFHGLSYTYLMSQLATDAGEEVANGRVILAHLGSGASMAAVLNGKPIDTTMSFTPTSGLVMGTRPGDMDPGLIVYLMKEQKRSADEMEKFLAEECGLLGVSELSADMRDLIAARATNARAADAVELFCYQVKKHLCAMAAALGGLDTVVFSGGIGEHSPETRSTICEGLQFLGMHLEPSKNSEGCDIISSDVSRVSIRIIPTNEEIVIARTIQSILQKSGLFSAS